MISYIAGKVKKKLAKTTPKDTTHTIRVIKSIMRGV